MSTEIYAGTAATRSRAGELELPDTAFFFGFLILVLVIVGAVVLGRDRRKMQQHQYRPKRKPWWRRMLGR